jgi:hypothetical protein
VEAAVQSLDNVEENMNSLYPDSAEDFWEGYDSPVPVMEEGIVVTTEDKSETDYWAQYSNVHGKIMPAVSRFNGFACSVIDRKCGFYYTVTSIRSSIKFGGDETDVYLRI